MGNVASSQRDSLEPVEAARAHEQDLLHDLPPPENKRFYPALDGLRAVAVLMVFVNHYLWAPAPLRWSWTGVDMFFVLSGFLITGILYDTRETRHRFRNFYVRRSLRIFPLYYGVLLVILLLGPLFHWVWHPVWYLWPIYLGNYGRFLWSHDFQTTPILLDHLLSARASVHRPLILYFGHFWTLCVEEQFYLVWPLVVFLVKDRETLKRICVVVFVLAMAGRVAGALLLPPDLLGASILERLTIFRVDALLLGGWVALSLRGPEAPRLERYATPMIGVPVAAFALLQLFYLATTHHLYRLANWPTVLCTVGFSFIDLFAAGILLRTINPSSSLFLMLNNRWLRRLGQISYGFYVFHDIPHTVYQRLVERFMPHVAHPNWPVAAIAFCVTLVLSYLSFRFFEAPFLRLKDRYTV